ncbi:MAG: ribosomal protein S18-alanine N-acetyltransferase [Nitrospirota bacterium]
MGSKQGLKIIITKMTDDDLNKVVEIEEASFNAPWSRRMFLSELSGNPFSRLYTARIPDKDEIVGYICFWLVFEELHLMNLAVHPYWRREGIGEELLRWAVLKGREAGAKTATLEVRSSNDAARGLYEKVGFKPRSIRRNYYSNPKEDAVIMRTENISN